MTRNKCKHQVQLFVSISILILCCPSSNSLRIPGHGNVNANGNINANVNANLIRKIPRGGGSSPIEPNSNYVNYNQYMPPTLGDEDANQIRRQHQYQKEQQQQQQLFQRQQYQYQNQNQYPNQNMNQNMNMNNNNSQQLKPLTQIIQEFTIKLQQKSPTIYYTMLASIIIFITWQLPFPTTNHILRDHFVCSLYNLKKQTSLYPHIHTLLTSTISHNSLSHLVMNLYGFYIFGNNIESILKQHNMSLLSYCIYAGILSNLCFLLTTPQGSCIGLSGVSLSLLALDAKIHPAKEIGFVVRFIPIRLPAQYALTLLFLWSMIGTLQSCLGGKYDGVAHGVHLGGLLYGVFVYELLNRGLYKKYMFYGRKLVYQFQLNRKRIMKNRNHKKSKSKKERI
jgi:membrane associated rhomboid family serine protease